VCHPYSAGAFTAKRLRVAQHIDGGRARLRSDGLWAVHRALGRGRHHKCLVCAHRAHVDCLRLGPAEQAGIEGQRRLAIARVQLMIDPLRRDHRRLRSDGRSNDPERLHLGWLHAPIGQANPLGGTHHDPDGATFAVPVLPWRSGPEAALLSAGTITPLLALWMARARRTPGATAFRAPEPARVRRNWEPDAIRTLLLAPGPLTTSDATRAALGRDRGSRDADFVTMSERVRRRLMALVHGQATHVAVPPQGAGTFAIEVAIGTLVPRGGKLGSRHRTGLDFAHSRGANPGMANHHCA